MRINWTAVGGCAAVAVAVAGLLGWAGQQGWYSWQLKAEHVALVSEVATKTPTEDHVRLAGDVRDLRRRSLKREIYSAKRELRVIRREIDDEKEMGRPVPRIYREHKAQIMQQIKDAEDELEEGKQ